MYHIFKDLENLSEEQKMLTNIHHYSDAVIFC